MGKKIGWKILPKDGKRMNPVQIFGILAVRELPFHRRDHSFGLLMPELEQKVYIKVIKRPTKVA